MEAFLLGQLTGQKASIALALINTAKMLQLGAQVSYQTGLGKAHLISCSWVLRNDVEMITGIAFDNGYMPVRAVLPGVAPDCYVSFTGRGAGWQLLPICIGSSCM